MVGQIGAQRSRRVTPPAVQPKQDSAGFLVQETRGEGAQAEEMDLPVMRARARHGLLPELRRGAAAAARPQRAATCRASSCAQFSNLDARLARTFRALLARPGALTRPMSPAGARAFSGRCSSSYRQRLFFALQSLTHFNIFSSTLESHLTSRTGARSPRRLVDGAAGREARDLAAFAPVFDHAAVLNAKALIILMALAFVPFLPLFFPARTGGSAPIRLRAPPLRLHAAAHLGLAGARGAAVAGLAAAGWPRRRSTWR